VSVISVTQQTLKRKVTVVGTIVPRETTLVNVDLAGATIETIVVEEGDLVTQGQLLVELDASTPRVELLQNDAHHDSAKAQIDQAKP
jgi:multidrug efflux pump subunit AcrA (membrane-fusion protein)